MKVSLVEWTKRPEKIASLAWKVMQEDINDVIDGQTAFTNDTMEKLVDQLKGEALGTPFEFINMVWYLDGVSRAFTHQFVRHRVGWSFAQQSMRVVSKEDFAKNLQFHVPPNVKDSSQFHVAMYQIEEIYSNLLKHGEEPEVARGVLPTNIHTTIMAACSYRAWRNMAIQRSCVRAQGEFAEVVKAMREEVSEKMGPMWADIKPPCDYTGICMIPSQYCGRLGNGKKVIGRRFDE